MISSHKYWRLAESDQQQLAACAETGSTYAQQAARNILCFYYGYGYVPQTPEEEPEPKKGKNKPHHTVSSAQQHLAVKVYPNPSRGQVIFEYRYPGILENLHIEIYTADGNLVEKIRMQGSNGIHVWDCKNCPSGNYVYRITSTGKQLDSDVLQINK